MPKDVRLLQIGQRKKVSIVNIVFANTPQLHVYIIYHHIYYMDVASFLFTYFTKPRKHGKLASIQH